MSCCEYIYRNFVNEAVTTIPYTGDVPTVSILYLIDGEWTMGVSQVVKLVGGNIVIDHGGTSTGTVKIIP